MQTIKFTEYKLSKKWNDLSVKHLDGHGWCVLEGKFNSIVASYESQKECEKFATAYCKASV